ncbi:DNA cytosine methyltransferase [Prescottella agglutinans]|uniref:DNA (cytosine-5-)-methyltransferase n=1 Tax=Prescottella agglutinans TaxID=1644129 RepID=A0ABT6M4T3_9NOCA|nr:DNA cytosine methyltransferase [Prescottella agglutinans]MDH6279323.1 DNA (cytosine-5)-methyltransferase 1 [Prescottella agglutinans]
MSSLVLFPSKPRVLEFFAGVGLARMGLEAAGFEVCWANDIEPDKREMYLTHYGDEGHFHLGDVHNVSVDKLPEQVDIAWASSPCTDLSLAGNRSGLRGRESSAFYGFTRVLEELGEHRPKVAVLENVVGLATSHGGDDLAAAVRAFNELGYSVDVITIDAKRFVAQSRPRLFLIAAQNPPASDLSDDSELRPAWLQPIFSAANLRMHRAPIVAPPALRERGLGATLERLPDSDLRWWDAERLENFTASMSPVQSARLNTLKKARSTTYRTAYRRTRNGVAVWEMRPDDIAGCLRTARGGSSKQAVVRLGNGKIAARWMTGREYARLMGAGDYNLNGLRDSQVHFAFGDAVAVPVVQWLAENYLMPLIKGRFDSNIYLEGEAVV